MVHNYTLLFGSDLEVSLPATALSLVVQLQALSLMFGVQPIVKAASNIPSMTLAASNKPTITKAAG